MKVLCVRKGREFPGFAIEPGDAVVMWERLRTVTPKTGWYPLIVRDDHGTFGKIDDEAPGSTDEELAAAAQLDIDKWLSSARKALEDHDGAQMPRNPGATAEPQTDLAILSDYQGNPARLLFIMLVPTTDGCEFPAHLKYGGWNDCPEPSVHVAMLKRWRDMYGAEPIAVSGDTIELRVSKPPKLMSDAQRLAEEQYLYCGDIVDQGVESIDALAFALMRSQYWFFWWD